MPRMEVDPNKRTRTSLSYFTRSEKTFLGYRKISSTQKRACPFQDIEHPSPIHNSPEFRRAGGPACSSTTASLPRHADVIRTLAAPPPWLQDHCLLPKQGDVSSPHGLEPPWVRFLLDEGVLSCSTPTPTPTPIGHPAPLRRKRDLRIRRPGSQSRVGTNPAGVGAQ